MESKGPRVFFVAHVVISSSLEVIELFYDSQQGISVKPYRGALLVSQLRRFFGIAPIFF